MTTVTKYEINNETFYVELVEGEWVYLRSYYDGHGMRLKIQDLKTSHPVS